MQSCLLQFGVVQMGTVHAYAKARGYPTYPRASWADLASSLLVSVPALLTPAIIIGGKVFGGIMLGLTFHLLNRVFANLGLLQDWPPFFAAISP